MRNFKIFNSVIRMLDISYRSFSWNGAAKRKSENLGGNNIFENAERENNFEVEKVRRKNSIIPNHKYSDLIHVNLNNDDSDQPIPADLTKTRSINDSDNICAIEKILSLLVHLVHTPSTVPTPQIFTYGIERDP